MICPSGRSNIVSRPVAQLAEWRSPKPQVGGSIPSWPAKHLLLALKMSNSKLKLVDVASWFGIVLITIAALVATNFGGLAGPLVAMVWIVWLVLTLILAYFTEKGKTCYTFAKESKVELEKVVWPSKQETTQTTLIVIIMVAITGVVLWGVDSGMTWAIGKVTQLG